MRWEEIKNAIGTGIINQVFTVLALKLAECYFNDKEK